MLSIIYLYIFHISDPPISPLPDRPLNTLVSTPSKISGASSICAVALTDDYPPSPFKAV